MEKVIRNYLGQLKAGDKQTYKNLTMFPLLSSFTSSLDYLLLDEALTEHVIEIVEINQGGSVPEIKLINKSSKRVLILDGEELVGAKQNRIVNTTIFAEANSTVVIPVSCVEHGRWNYQSEQFYSQERIMPSKLRAMKARQVHNSIRTSGEFRSNQTEIWDEIQEKAVRMPPCRCTGSGARSRKDSKNWCGTSSGR